MKVEPKEHSLGNILMLRALAGLAREVHKGKSIPGVLALRLGRLRRNGPTGAVAALWLCR